MGTAENRRSERIMLNLPILVVGIDTSGEEFTEETHTVLLNREGALIALQHTIAPQSTIRIINLQNDAAANFRVWGARGRSTSEGDGMGRRVLERGHEHLGR